MTKKTVTALIALLLAVLTGCATLPLTGPVVQGNGVISEPGPVFPQGYAPQVDADPEQIVRGFLGASAAGLPDNFAVAREYLTTEMRSQWVPQAGVVAFSREGVLTVAEGDAVVEPQSLPTSAVTTPAATQAQVQLSVHVDARLDEAGRYTQAQAGEEQSFTFELVRDEANQWRIAQLSDGILLSQPNFESVYRMVPLYFLSPDGTHLVPEQRWFPLHNAATYAVRELLAGPSNWLRDGVMSAFPAGTTLLRDSVLVDSSGSAQVDLSEAALVADSRQRRLVVAQLEHTLGPVSGVRNVEVMVNGLPMDVDGEVELIRDPVAEGGLSALRNGAIYGFDSNSGLLVRRTDLVEVGDLNVTALATGPYAEVVAVRVGTREIMVVPPVSAASDFSSPDDGGAGAADPPDPEADAEVGGEAEVIDLDPQGEGEGEEAGQEDAEFEPLFDFTAPYPVLSGTNLLRPTIDRYLWIWSGETDNPGELRAVRPMAVTDPETDEVEITADWLKQREVLDIKVSRDGTRIAVLSELEGELVLEVAVVVRTGNGTPVRLADPLRVGAQLSDAVSVVWLDELTLGTLGDTKIGEIVTSPTITVVPLAGGLRKITTNVEGANWLTTARGEERMAIGVPDLVNGDEEGPDISSIYSRSGSGWNLISSRAVYFPTYPG